MDACSQLRCPESSLVRPCGSFLNVSTARICAGVSAGIIRTSIFANSTPESHYVDANGTWLASPDAALIGNANNSDVPNAVLLALSAPVYDAATQVCQRLCCWPRPARGDCIPARSACMPVLDRLSPTTSNLGCPACLFQLPDLRFGTGKPA